MDGLIFSPEVFTKYEPNTPLKRRGKKTTQTSENIWKKNEDSTANPNLDLDPEPRSKKGLHLRYQRSLLHTPEGKELFQVIIPFIVGWHAKPVTLVFP